MSMSINHDSPNSSKSGEDSHYQLNLVDSSSNSSEPIQFCKVQKSFKTWRKENTCKRCGITYENFQSLLNHSCQPYRCASCSMAFLFDYMLKMHKCGIAQPNTRNFRKTHCCEVCQMSFPEQSLLLKHKSLCGKIKQCTKCQKHLNPKNQTEFCRKCKFLLDKDQKHSQRYNTLIKFRSGFEDIDKDQQSSADERDSMSTDSSVSIFNHVHSHRRSELLISKRKRQSLNDFSRKSCRRNSSDLSKNIMTRSDTSLDSLDTKCKFEKRGINSNLQNSLVTVLKNSSKKKKASLSSTASNEDLYENIAETNGFAKSCNGISSPPFKNFRKNIRSCRSNELDTSISLLSDPKIKRNDKTEGFVKSIDVKCRKEISPLKKDTFDSQSEKEDCEKRNGISLSPKNLRKNGAIKKSSELLNVANNSLMKDNKTCKTDGIEKSYVIPSLPSNNLKKNILVKDKKNDLAPDYAQDISLLANSKGFKASKSEKASKETIFVLGEESEDVFLKGKRGTLQPDSKDISSSKNGKISKADELKKLADVKSVPVKNSKKNIRKNSVCSDFDQNSSFPKDAEVSNTNKLEKSSKLISLSSVSLTKETATRGRRTRIQHNSASQLKTGKSCKEDEMTNSSNIKPSITSCGSENGVVGKKTNLEAVPSKISSLTKMSKDITTSIEKSASVLTQDLSKKLHKNNVIRRKRNNIEPGAATKVALQDKTQTSAEHYVEISTTTRKKSKNKDNVESKTELLDFKKQSLGAFSIKSVSMRENLLKKNIGTVKVKQKSDLSKSNSKSKSCESTESFVSSSINYTPELEISESTLNSVPDTLISIFVNKDTQKSGNSHQKSRVSNSDNDSIKLESLLNVLPDVDSGILLKVTSTNDSYRCLKCNKLFRKIKTASVHYANCKGSRMKRNMLVLLKDIQWICLTCHFHCTQMGELNFHKRSCSKPTNNVSIDYCIKYYNATCSKSRLFCPKCGLNCISSIMLDKHSCQQRLERFKKCIINVEKLDMENNDVKKYECAYCESVFFTSNAYAKHIEKHKISNENSQPQEHCVSDKKNFTTQQIKKIIKSELVETSDDVVKNWLKPISSMCSRLKSEKDPPFDNLNLNIVVPNTVDSLLSKTAEKLLEKEKERENFLLPPESELSLNMISGSSDPTHPDSQMSAVPWRAYMKDFGCRCKKHENIIEEKPCLSCLNMYIKKRGFFYDSSDPSQVLHNNTNKVEVDSCSSLPTCSNIEGVSDNLRYPASLDNNKTSLIHIASVSSCSAQAALDGTTFAVRGSNNCLPDLPSYVPALSNGIPNELGNMKISASEQLAKSFIKFILVIKVGYVDSKYSIDSHNHLMRSLYDLKLEHMAGPFPDISKVPGDTFYMLTEHKNDEPDKCTFEFLNGNISEKVDMLDPRVMNYIRIEGPLPKVMRTLMDEEPCDFDVLLCNHSHHFHVSWQYAKEITYNAYCLKCDSEPSGIQFICGLCFDTVSSELLVEHFEIAHTGQVVLNLLIQ